MKVIERCYLLGYSAVYSVCEPTSLPNHLLHAGFWLR
jgi:hypothetical protein